MYSSIRALLFQLAPETAHALTLYALRGTQVFPPARWTLERFFAAPPKPVTAFGLTFQNPVGLAAGYDKDGIAVRGLSALGFGHIEIGTVTPRPQYGNPKPRVFRLVKDEAIINRMGFPGKGADLVAISLRGATRLRRSNLLADKGIASPATQARNDTILGLNLGKNKDTPLENAANDYIMLMRVFTPLADYLAINISSPNTVGLRRLQGRDMLESLLSKIATEREQIYKSHAETHIKNFVNSVVAVVNKIPILVKLAPDLNDEELNDAIGVILGCGMDGIIATNTTLAREGLRSGYQTESGGLSGSPLRVRSEAMLEKIVRAVNGSVPIVSVGGIMSPEDAKRRLDIGATLVQVYTGLIYRGPGLVREIVEAV